MQFSFSHFDFPLMKEMTLFSSFIFINMIADQINWNIDKFILGRFYGTIIVAIYGLVAQINSYYLSLSTAISNVFIPRVNKMVAMNCDSDRVNAVVYKDRHEGAVHIACFYIYWLCLLWPSFHQHVGRKKLRRIVSDSLVAHFARHNTSYTKRRHRNTRGKEHAPIQVMVILIYCHGNLIISIPWPGPTEE